MIFVDEDKCTGCGDCLQVCPGEGAIVLQEDKAVINRDLCTSCAACLAACSEGAIHEVEAAPALAPSAQPVQAERRTTLARAGPLIASTLAAAAPLAVDALAGLVRGWLDERSVARRTGGQAGPGSGSRPRRRRARGGK